MNLIEYLKCTHKLRFVSNLQTGSLLTGNLVIKTPTVETDFRLMFKLAMNLMKHAVL
jgi:hypothetical protein